MDIEYYPDKKTVKDAMRADDPLLMLITYDGEKALLANIDDAFEHVILLRKMGYPETDIVKYFRLVVNQHGVDWTFVCPGDYKGIKDKSRRIEEFYNDGIKKITAVIKFIGYRPNINIPQRYRPHFDQ